MKFLFPLALCLVGCPLFAQTNLSFNGLKGWSVPPRSSGAGYSAEARSEGCRSAACAVLIAPDEPASGGMGNVEQTFDAAPYRGKAIRLRAWLKVEGNDTAAQGQAWVRVALKGGRLGFFDTMGDRPVRSRQWQLVEISGEVASDAQSVTIGFLSRGKGRVWVDGVSLAALPEPADALTVSGRAAIQAAYRRIDAAYGGGDVDAIASFALPDAQIVMGAVRMAMAEALAPIMDQIRHGLKFRSESTVTSIRISGDQAAVFVNNVATRTEAGKEQGVASSTRDTWVRTPEGWRLKESALIDTHPVGQ